MNQESARGGVVVRRLTTQRFSRRHRENGMGAATAEARLQGLEIAQQIRELADIPAPADVAERLGVAVGDQVFVRRRRVMLADGTPLQLADSYLPLDIAQGRIREPNSGPGGTYARIEEGGRILTQFKEWLWHRPASADERQELELDEGDHVIELHRVAFAGDQPVECFVGVMAASRHTFEHEIDAT